MKMDDCFLSRAVVVNEGLVVQRYVSVVWPSTVAARLRTELVEVARFKELAKVERVWQVKVQLAI